MFMIGFSLLTVIFCAILIDASVRENSIEGFILIGMMIFNIILLISNIDKELDRRQQEIIIEIQKVNKT